MRYILKLAFLVGIVLLPAIGFTDDQENLQEQQKALNDVNSVLTNARAVPNFENGEPAGYTVVQPSQGSGYQKLGLKDGDVITTVDGQQVDNPQQAFQKLSESKAQNIDIVRDGETSRSPAQDQ
jgi:general secretion pathway protein C